MAPVVQNPGKVDLNRLAFAAVVVTVAVLVALGKLPPNAFTVLMAGAAGWLLPSPTKPMGQDDGHDSSVDHSP